MHIRKHKRVCSNRIEYIGVVVIQPACIYSLTEHPMTSDVMQVWLIKVSSDTVQM